MPEPSSGDKQFFLDRIQAIIDAGRERYARQGWTFLERDAEHHTIADLISAVLRIDRAADARRFYRGYVAFLEALPPEQRSAGYTVAQIAQANIGWCFGEGMDGDRIALWHHVSGAAHPVFGATMPTAQEAFAAGVAAGKAARDA